MQSALQYRVTANPVSGSLSKAKRYGWLKAAAAILHAKIYGLDTGTAEELAQCARKQATQCDVLVVAGGDGTLSLVMNAVDLSTTVLAFLPFGTGNALSHALHYRGGPGEIAARICQGEIHACDLIDCGGKQKAFMASLGFDGTAIRLYEWYHSLGHRGLKAHLMAVIRTFFWEYRPTDASVALDGHIMRVRRLWSLLVVKQPFFGMGLKAVPQAQWSDAHLHTLTITHGWLGMLTGLITGFTIGNRIGAYRCGKNLIVNLRKRLTLQIDGELGWTADQFAFRVLPGELKLKH